ncbi:MAG: hypothetical protein FJ116_11625 [Deltaproteobacteria bacterium]|nr:hypothetical protein [Deltaproteobacteria bacterium]
MNFIQNWKVYGGLGFVLVCYFLFPGNVDWICDQPLLIEKALEANRFNRWGELGIAGGNGTLYGPVPNFIYQVLLRVTHDLVGVVLLKILISVALIFIGLFRISNDLNLKKEGMIFAFLSPFVYFYTRTLWDNVFLIPVSVIYCSSVIRYSLFRREIEFVLATVTAAILFHIHLMSVIVLIPGCGLINILLLKEKHKRIFLLLLLQLIMVFVSLPYLKAIFLAKTLVPYGKPQWAAIIFSPLLGLRLVGYVGFFEYFSPNFFASFSGIGKIIIYFLIGVSLIGPIMYLGGLKSLFSSRNGFPVQVRWFFISVLAMTVFISLKMKLKAHPHYMNASWAVYFCIFWKKLSDSYTLNRIRKMVWLWAGSMVLLLVVWIEYISSNSGDRGLHFGPTLNNQIAIAKQLDAEEPLNEITVDVENFSIFPQRLTVLAGLYGIHRKSVTRMKLVYAEDYPSAEIKLIPIEK